MYKNVHVHYMYITCISYVQKCTCTYIHVHTLYVLVQNELLPASDRIPPHTRKKPTGAFDRSRLLQHLKTEAAESKIGEDYIPFVKKTPKEAPAQVQILSSIAYNKKLNR